MDHFAGKIPLNLPYYFHRILTKMSHKVQVKPNQIQNTLLHFGLIGMIVLEELRRRERVWENFLFWGGFELEAHPENNKKKSKKKSLTSQSSSRKRRAITPLETREPSSSSKKKGAKKKLVFDETTKQPPPKQTNVLNLPYSESESDPATEEVPIDQSIELSMEEAPQIEVFTSFDEGETSTKKKISKSGKNQKLKDKLAEHEVLERVLKARYETMSKNFAETSEDFERLALKHVKEKRKMKNMIKKNYKPWKIVRCLKIKIKLLTTKSTSCSYFQVLAKVAEKLNEESS
jgi:hypothetical protein